MIGNRKKTFHIYLFIHPLSCLFDRICVCVCLWGSSPWHYRIYVSKIVCVGNCGINQSSAVIVRLIVRYVPVDLEALVCVNHVRICELVREG